MPPSSPPRRRASRDADTRNLTPNAAIPDPRSPGHRKVSSSEAASKPRTLREHRVLLSSPQGQPGAHVHGVGYSAAKRTSREDFDATSRSSPVDNRKSYPSPKSVSVTDCSTPQWSVTDCRLVHHRDAKPVQSPAATRPTALTLILDQSRPTRSGA